MGLIKAITGAAGGVFRDVLMNQVPLIFRGEIYALACIAGGTAYWGLHTLGLNNIVCGLTCGAIVIIIRLLAVMFKLHLPVLKGEDN